MKTHYYLLVILAFSFTAEAQIDTLRLTQSVYFASAVDEPNSVELAKLELFAGNLKGYASYILRIEAFTDEQGTTEYNEDLAQRRALHCSLALAQINVTSNTTTVLTHGEQRAQQNTSTDAERKNDRRVDLVATVVRWRNVGEAIASTEPKQVVKKLNPTLSQSIKGNKGGFFKIAPNTLIREDGTPAVGPVSVELTEAYELTDILLAGLTTTSGGQRLETGGMVNLTATDAEGQSLQLKTGTAITASIPTDYYNPDMKIFTGVKLTEDGVPTDWELTKGSVRRPDKPESDILTYEEYLEKMSRLLDLYINQFSTGTRGCDFVYDMRPEPCRDFYNWLTTHPTPDTPVYINFAAFHVPPKPEPVDTNAIVYQPVGSEKIFMSKKQKQGITAQRRQRALKVYISKLQRHERSKAHKAEIPMRNVRLQEQYKKEILAWREQVTEQKQTALASLTRHDYLISEAMRLEMADDRKAAEKARLEANERMEAELLGAADLSGKSWDIERYVFNINQLGWANCDMFIRESNPGPVQVRIDYSSPSAKVMLLPVARRSVVAYQRQHDGTWRNQGIPKGISYHVIAYEIIDGRLVMAHKFVSAANRKLQELNYQPVAITELRDKMVELLEAKSK
jgi:hypothetical protein